MTLETFFKKFNELADTPNGVKQLRELVKQLAVEGGLVPHLAAEPAVPYASIEDATAINVSDVPENWRVVLLADAIKNRSGNSKLIKGRLHEEPAAGRFQGFSASGADVWCDDYQHEGQAIIISAVGARCGKAFKASGKWSAIANTNITRPELSLFDFDFAYLVLNNEHFWVRGGSAQPFVKFPPSLDRHFALPPLAEQKRIVAKVNELMALCDRLEAQQQERETKHAALARASLARFAETPTPANLNLIFHKSFDIPPADLRKSILSLAVQGKLVPQNPNDEPAIALRITPQKANGKKAKWAGKVEEQEQPFQLPLSWNWFRLGDVSSLKHGYAFSSNFFTSKPAAFVLTTPGNFYENGGFRDRESKRKYYSGPVDPEFVFKPGDLIIPMTEQAAGLLGSPAFIPDDGRVYIHNQRLGKLTFLDSIVPEFAYWFFNIEFFRGELARTCTGMKVRHTSPDRILRVPFPVCPLAEQRRIVAKVKQLMALVDALETQLAASRDKGQKLLEAVVSELTSA